MSEWEIKELRASDSLTLRLLNPASADLQSALLNGRSVIRSIKTGVSV